MRINISQDILARALRVVNRAISSHTTSSILSGIKLTATSKGLTLTSSQPSMILEYEVPIQQDKLDIQQTGSSVVPAKHFTEIIRALPADNISLQLNEQHVMEITTEQAVYRICGMVPDEFPAVPVNRYTSLFRISCLSLQQAIRQIAFAASTAEHASVLAGVLFEISHDSLTLRATDGVRYASTTVEWNRIQSNQSGDYPPIIIAAKQLLEVAKLLGDKQNELEVGVSSNQAKFSTEHWMMHCTFLRGHFPSVTVPPAFKSSITLHTSQLQQAVERAILLSGDSHVIHMQTSGHRMKLSAQAHGIGDVSEYIDIHDCEGDDALIALNGKYLHELIRSIGSDMLSIQLSGTRSPVVIKPYDRSPLVYLLTPIRTRDTTDLS
ncbi:DNA polymerase III subunit beta [Paenibacillus sp. chi10]|uniref:Beta sliding clamp n=1 Tax=Paenibacillus suaedae TaxID=3077233 RepID=A0AAJ2N6E3_9BACL|nr:DNA polymerase III subunit beta [Paenibacillus sp. chi10]MDT8978570.1 DNA polymerase III subunit beta [Paenibacillus sp. chi10]